MSQKEERILNVRIRRDGNYHQGDLNRLRGAGRIISVDHPDVPHGAVLVRVGPDTERPQLVDDISTRPPSFHP